MPVFVFTLLSRDYKKVKDGAVDGLYLLSTRRWIIKEQIPSGSRHQIRDFVSSCFSADCILKIMWKSHNFPEWVPCSTTDTDNLSLIQRGIPFFAKTKVCCFLCFVLFCFLCFSFLITSETGEKKVDIRRHPLTCIFNVSLEQSISAVFERNQQGNSSISVYLCSRLIQFLIQGC